MATWKEPSGWTVAVPSTVPPVPVTVTCAPGSPLPLRLLPSPARTRPVGLSGAWVSGADTSTAADRLPAASRCSTVSAWPLVCGSSRVISKAPPAPTTVLPSTLPSGPRTVTVAPGSPLPVIVVPVPSMAGLVTTCGGVESGAVKSTGPALLPRLSVASTVRLSPLRCGALRVTSKRPSPPTVAVPSTLPSASRTVTMEPL
ncbi:hypothetical protein D3C80_1304040 [compost metagenome]